MTPNILAPMTDTIVIAVVILTVAVLVVAICVPQTEPEPVNPNTKRKRSGRYANGPADQNKDRHPVPAADFSYGFLLAGEPDARTLHACGGEGVSASEGAGTPRGWYIGHCFQDVLYLLGRVVSLASTWR